MSKLHKRFLNRLNLWLGSLIAILTGTACDPIVLPTYGVPPLEDMYGPAPGPVFRVMGNVHNDTGEALQRMQVVINCGKNDTTYTDGGYFEQAYNSIPKKVTLIVNDTTNTYESYTTTKNIDIDGLDGNDFMGRYLSFDIMLTKKPDTNNQDK